MSTHVHEEYEMSIVKMHSKYKSGMIYNAIDCMVRILTKKTMKKNKNKEKRGRLYGSASCLL